MGESVSSRDWLVFIIGICIGVVLCAFFDAVDRVGRPAVHPAVFVER
jgi:hypothetical protein